MEDVSTIFMDVDALDILAIDVSAKMLPLVDDKTTLALLVGEVGERGSEQA